MRDRKWMKLGGDAPGPSERGLPGCRAERYRDESFYLLARTTVPLLITLRGTRPTPFERTAGRRAPTLPLPLPPTSTPAPSMMTVLRGVIYATNTIQIDSHSTSNIFLYRRTRISDANALRNETSCPPATYRSPFLFFSGKKRKGTTAIEPFVSLRLRERYRTPFPEKWQDEKMKISAID